MSDFDPHISIENIQKSKDVKCAAKEMTLDNTRFKIETPFKVLSGRDLTKNTLTLLENEIHSPIFELQKFYDWAPTYTTLNNAVLEHDGKGENWVAALRNNIGLTEHLEKTYRRNITISVAFQYYPLDDIMLRKKLPKPYCRLEKETYDAYLKFIHNASSALVLTPDVSLPPSAKRTFSFDEYLRFIDYSVETIQTYNNKPIFVPVQIDLAANELTDILGHYKGKGFTNLWINCKAQKCDGSNAGKIDLINEKIASFYKDEEVVVYSSHLKQERDAQETEIPAYDMYPPFRGADFVGITRNRRGGGSQENPDEDAQKKGFEDHSAYLDAVKLRKFSLFDADSYKYYIPQEYHTETLDEKILIEITQKKSACDLFNSVLIENELHRARDQILDGKSLKEYLESKSGIVNSMDVFSYAMKTTKQQKRSYQRLLP